MSEQDEIFLRKSLVGTISEKEIDKLITKTKRIARKHEITFSELIDYLFDKFSAITGVEKWKLLIELIGKEN
ncbi:hypothetical protein ES705_08129 [subsurface metagenome]